MSYRLTNIEKETIITMNEYESFADVEVMNLRLKKRLRELHIDRPNEIKLLRKDEYADVYTVPKSWIKINPPRVLSEEAKERRKEHMDAVNAKRLSL